MGLLSAVLVREANRSAKGVVVRLHLPRPGPPETRSRPNARTERRQRGARTRESDSHTLPRGPRFVRLSSAAPLPQPFDAALRPCTRHPHEASLLKSPASCPSAGPQRGWSQPAQSRSRPCHALGGESGSLRAPTGGRRAWPCPPSLPAM